jgi:hypothetical protein
MRGTNYAIRTPLLPLGISTPPLVAHPADGREFPRRHGHSPCFARSVASWCTTSTSPSVSGPWQTTHCS